jgi:hypothetical protein
MGEMDAPLLKSQDSKDGKKNNLRGWRSARVACLDAGSAYACRHLAHSERREYPRRRKSTAPCIVMRSCTRAKDTEASAAKASENLHDRSDF